MRSRQIRINPRLPRPEMQKPHTFIPPLAWKNKPSQKQKALAAWRGIHLEEQEKANANNARSVADLIPSVLKNIGLERKRADLEILKVWSHMIDPTIVAHAQPTALVRGTLMISVDSNVWLDELVRYRRHEILKRLQYSFGKDLIQRLSFRVG